jgi:hypothetical protein
METQKKGGCCWVPVFRPRFFRFDSLAAYFDRATKQQQLKRISLYATGKGAIIRTLQPIVEWLCTELQFACPHLHHEKVQRKRWEVANHGNRAPFSIPVIEWAAKRTASADDVDTVEKEETAVI